MSAKKVWGVILIVLGVIGMLYGGSYYLEVSDTESKLNILMNTSNGITQLYDKIGSDIPMNASNEILTSAYNQMYSRLDSMYLEAVLIFCVGAFLSVVGTIMLRWSR